MSDPDLAQQAWQRDPVVVTLMTRVRRRMFRVMPESPLIEVLPDVCHGKPCIAGTRILVSSILSQLAGGYGFERIRAGYPELTDEHIRAAIEYARALVEDEDVVVLGP